MMKLTRIDSDRELNKDVERIEITIGGIEYTLTQSVDGKLEVHGHADELIVYPGCQNTLCLQANYKD